MKAPLTFEEFKIAFSNGHIKDALDQLLDELENVFFTSGLEALNEEQRVVFSVASFVGQVRDGGIQSFLDSSWSVCLEALESSFVRIGLPEYAVVAAQIMRMADGDESRKELAMVEDAFWALFYSVPDGDALGIDQKLASFACANPRTFTGHGK